MVDTSGDHTFKTHRAGKRETGGYTRSKQYRKRARTLHLGKTGRNKQPSPDPRRTEGKFQREIITIVKELGRKLKRGRKSIRNRSPEEF